MTALEKCESSGFHLIYFPSRKSHIEFIMRSKKKFCPDEQVQLSASHQTLSVPVIHQPVGSSTVTWLIDWISYIYSCMQLNEMQLFHLWIQIYINWLKLCSIKLNQTHPLMVYLHCTSFMDSFSSEFLAQIRSVLWCCLNTGRRALMLDFLKLLLTICCIGIASYLGSLPKGTEFCLSSKVY